MSNREQAPAQRDAAPAPASAFRVASREGEVYELPGVGLPARLRRLPVRAMASIGELLPNPIAQAVMQLAVMAERDEAPQTPDQIQVSVQRHFNAYVRAAELCFVEPRFVHDREPDYDAGEIGVADLTDIDYVWLYWTFLQGTAERVRPFRFPRRAPAD